MKRQKILSGLILVFLIIVSAGTNWATVNDQAEAVFVVR